MIQAIYRELLRDHLQRRPLLASWHGLPSDSRRHVRRPAQLHLDSTGPLLRPRLLSYDGNFYGTTSCLGGPLQRRHGLQNHPSGTVTVLHAFTSDGASPTRCPDSGDHGILPRTTVKGGGTGCFGVGCGTVFQMTPSGVVTVLHAFTPGTDGAAPYVDPIQAILREPLRNHLIRWRIRNRCCVSAQPSDGGRGHPGLAAHCD